MQQLVIKVYMLYPIYILYSEQNKINADTFDFSKYMDLVGLTVGFDNGRSENLLKSKHQETSKAGDSLYFLE